MCQLCLKATGNVYVITLGPGSTHKKPELIICGVCVLRCRASAIRVMDQFTSENCDVLAKWYEEFSKANISRSTPPLCECSGVGSKCDLCFLGEGIKLLRSKLSSVEDATNTDFQLSKREIVALGSPLFFACCKTLQGNKSRDTDLYSW